jgi:V/A-type H+/Na+-transporting ATPase subunit C
MANGVAGYAAINARVRVMYSSLLSEDTISQICEASDLNGLLELLKPTVYGPYLEKVKDRDLSARRVAFQIRGRLADAYTSIAHTAPENTRDLIAARYRYFEVDNLKAVLRGIVAGADWDRVRYVLFPYGSGSVLRAQEMLESGSVAAAVELLRGTIYYETLAQAMKRYSVEQNIFPLEVAIDLNYWRDLWAKTRVLAGNDRARAMRIIGTQVDMNNLMWAIRYRVYHQLSEEELINYTLPFGYHVRDEDIRFIAAGGDISQVVKRIYPEIPEVDSMLDEPRKGLPLLELELQRRLAETCRAAFLGDPFHIGIPLGFLTLCEMEIQDLVVLIEAKATQTAVEVYRPYLLQGSACKV